MDLTNAPYVLSSTPSSLSLQLDATDTNSKVAVYSTGASKLSLSDYASVDVAVTGSDNARVLLRFFLDDGSIFDIVRNHADGHPVWESPADLDALEFNLTPYAARSLNGLVYVALMSSDGTQANINITEVIFKQA